MLICCCCQPSLCHDTAFVAATSPQFFHFRVLFDFRYHVKQQFQRRFCVSRLADIAAMHAMTPPAIHFAVSARLRDFPVPPRVSVSLIFLRHRSVISIKMLTPPIPFCMLIAFSDMCLSQSFISRGRMIFFARACSPPAGAQLPRCFRTPALPSPCFAAARAPSASASRCSSLRAPRFPRFDATAFSCDADFAILPHSRAADAAAVALLPRRRCFSCSRRAFRLPRVELCCRYTRRSPDISRHFSLRCTGAAVVDARYAARCAAAAARSPFAVVWLSGGVDFKDFRAAHAAISAPRRFA